MAGDPTQRYLARHAEPGSVALAAMVPGAYSAAVIVPARDETVAMLDGLRPAMVGRDALAVVIVNGDDDDAARVRRANTSLIAELCAHGSVRTLRPGAHLVAWSEGTLLVLDHASPGRQLPTGQGVGRARRIGCDLALALAAAGTVERPFIDTTDADATLPADYFDVAPADAVAVARPFVHVSSGDSVIDEATQLYELTLRYYVAGLSKAGSPWAMHTIGSCLSVRGDAYATVRGMPVRRAGEDFYLLAKVAKLGAVARGHGAPVKLRARASMRVPFGTGPGARAIAETLAAKDVPRVYHPASFAAVGTVLARVRAWCSAPDDDPQLRSLAHYDDPVLAAAVDDLGVVSGLASAMRGASNLAQRLRRVGDWFDAFRTLKLVHGLRAHGHAMTPWPEAVAVLCGQPPPASVGCAMRALTELHDRDAGMAAWSGGSLSSGS